MHSSAQRHCGIVLRKATAEGRRQRKNAVGEQTSARGIWPAKIPDLRPQEQTIFHFYNSQCFDREDQSAESLSTRSFTTGEHVGSTVPKPEER